MRCRIGAPRWNGHPCAVYTDGTPIERAHARASNPPCDEWPWTTSGASDTSNLRSSLYAVRNDPPDHASASAGTTSVTTPFRRDALQRRPTATRHDNDVVACRSLRRRQLDDVRLGTPDVALRDHVHDAHPSHQPTASIHDDCQRSYE